LYKVVFTKRVVKDIKKLDNQLKKQTKLTIDKIVKNPFSGENIVGDLRSYNSIRIRSQWRLIYKINKNKIIIMGAGPHQIYEIIKRRLKI